MVYIMSFSKLLNIDDFIFLKYLLSLDFGIHKKVPCNFFFVVVLFSLLFYFEKKNPLIFSCLCAVGVCINVHVQTVGNGGVCMWTPKDWGIRNHPQLLFLPYSLWEGLPMKPRAYRYETSSLASQHFGRLYLIRPKAGITDWSPHPQGICLDHNSNPHTCLTIILSTKPPFGPTFSFLWT